jgi:serine protease AprX
MKQAWAVFSGMAITLLILTLVQACTQTRKIELSSSALPKEDLHNPYQVKVDPLFEVASISLSGHPDPNELKVSGIPRSKIYSDGSEWIDDQSKDHPPYPKVSPVLEEWLREMDDDDFVDIIISFEEDLRTPLLPVLEAGENRDDPNSKRAIAIAALERKRMASQDALLDELKNYGRFQKMGKYWIANCSLIRVQIGEIGKLANAEFVNYLQPKRGGELPPSDLNSGNDVEDFRQNISSDPYFDLGLTQPWIGILDTGVRESHQLLQKHIGRLGDCVNGGSTCSDSTQPDFATGDIIDHGTSTAAIIAGSPGNLLGPEYRGVSEVKTDSWRIYAQIGCTSASGGCLDSDAAVRGIQAGIAAYDRVLVGEIQANESESGCIARSANNAYDAGVVFVAANGNSGAFPEVVDSPALAHKVLGVGAFDIDSGETYVFQSQGPASGGRIKPDIQAPTDSETASSTSDTALHTFGATSGATPYAGAAAMLSRNWLHRMGYFENGQTYAFMILYGQKFWPYDNIKGAGPLVMATDGWASWGKVVLTHGLNIDIPISVAAGKQDFDVALWWPESASQDHNNIDVYLIDPNGVERAQAISDVSIFERTGVQGSLTAGDWAIRIRGESVPTNGKPVYWAATIGD